MLLNRYNQNNQQPVESPKTNQLNFNYHIKYWMFLGLCTSLLLHGLISFRHHNLLGYILGIQPVTASPTPTVNTIPSKYINNAPVPDWQSITFKSFVFSSPGSIELPNVEFPGYKSIRSWQAGQSLDEVMELGDFENVFNLENFSLQTIGQLSGISLVNTKLSDFQTIKWQTVPELTKAIPSLANEYVENVPPIRDLIKKILGVTNINGQTIGEIINDFPQIKDIELGEINLSDYNHSIAIYPVGGWWRYNSRGEEWNNTARYALIVSIRVLDEVEVDLYTPIFLSNKIKQTVPINL
jgi:hypothetical protein